LGVAIVRELADTTHFPKRGGRIELGDDALFSSEVRKAFDHFGLFMQDSAGALGFRIINRHPEWARWFIIQNTNAYEVGLTDAWGGLRNVLWKNWTPETEQGVVGLLEFETVKAIYLHGHKRPEQISPDYWNMDSRLMERPNGRRVQLGLFYDYRTNVQLHPQWQTCMRERQLKTLIFWGQDDIFFTRQGGEAYLRDLPNAEMHRLDSGHFAVEDCLREIVSNIGRFRDEKASSASQTGASRKTAR
jgi:pimeloyl-ACP methyl ester carboxylesterase